MANPRLQRLLDKFRKVEIDAFLVTKDVNITYLTQFQASESWLLVTKKGSFYITDFRYILEAEKGLKGISIKKYDRSMQHTVFELLLDLGLKRLGFDERHLSLAGFKNIQKECPKTIVLIGLCDVVEEIREIKEKAEVDAIRGCLKLHHQAIKFLRQTIKPGITEFQVLDQLEAFVKARRAGFSFPSIIASGPNSCFPHARVSRRKIKNNEPVLIDTGIDINGYKSDLTRVVLLGKIPPLVREVSEIVKDAQLKAIAVIKAGVPVAVADQEARNHFKKFDLEQYFGHSLGHGVGLEIHESPRLSVKSQAVFKSGMVVTVEPAVYLPHKFGVRIEDMVLVTEKGCEVLSDQTA
ncbi:MAG: aminopeptidase P family protein [Candidatus Omnitrophica bacterium]|nr:aminopeptidase P family protein [Candidatus Omnitrophota bacterium]